MTLTQQLNLYNYNKGRLLVNPSRGAKTVMAFKLLNNQYISTVASRNHKYSFDDLEWTSRSITLFEKLSLIVTGKVKKATYSAKADRVGI